MRATVERDDIVGILHKSVNRAGVVVADWSTDGGWYFPALRVDWLIQDAGVFVGEEAGISHECWSDLARAFLAELKPEEFRLTGE